MPTVSVTINVTVTVGGNDGWLPPQSTERWCPLVLNCFSVRPKYHDFGTRVNNGVSVEPVAKNVARPVALPACKHVRQGLWLRSTPPSLWLKM